MKTRKVQTARGSKKNAKRAAPKSRVRLSAKPNVLRRKASAAHRARAKTTSRTSRSGVEPLVRQLRARLRAVNAQYDAAQTTLDNSKHWAAADGLSAVAANSPEVRRKLRNRARYEVANNSYAHGISLTLANDCIGTGPRLQVLSDAIEHNRQVEDAFAEWAEAVDLAGKLRTARLAKIEDGEAFAILTTNPGLRNSVKLDVRLIEADQVTSAYVPTFDNPVDGIVFDQWGNPAAYQVLKTHPGDVRSLSPLSYDELKAASVLHYFTQLRPGQARGIPEITPALPLFAQLRRYTLAVIAAAETAADLAMVLESTGAASNDPPAAIEAMDTIELERRMATILPEGWKLGQARAEQPTTTYGDFKAEILNEIARCLSVPFNVAAGNSSKYNYASGRLDHQTYFKSIDVERSRIVRSMLNRIFSAWIDEAVLIEGLLPQPFRMKRRVPHVWFWDGQEHVDPVKEADAQETRLRSNTTTLSRECARSGMDWEEVLEQRSKERKRAKALGLDEVVDAQSRAMVPARATKDDDE